MLKIRLQRVGRKHEPGFRLVLTDSKNSTKSGRVAEILGSYDPRKTSELLHTERISHWLSKGAGLTASVNNLLLKKGIIRGKKIHVSKAVNVSAAGIESASTEGAVENPQNTPVEEPIADTRSATEEPITEPAPESAPEVAPESPLEAAPEAPKEEAPKESAPEV